MRAFLASIMICVGSLVALAAAETFPAWYETTSALNVRVRNDTRSTKLTTIPAHTKVKVESVTSNNWGVVSYSGHQGYVSMRYLRFVETDVPVSQTAGSTNKASKSKKGSSLWSWLIFIVISTAGIVLCRHIAMNFIEKAAGFMYRAYWIVCVPFYCLNWLQRYLSKPWRFLYKGNSGRDYHNRTLRTRYEWAKVPLYILLTPLRFYNAVYFNMVVHCAFEMYNYIIEVFMPSNDEEGADEDLRLVCMTPYRVLKYVVWHGGLTVIESAIWTVIDTFVPALTLFHGTNEQASTTITHAGRDGYSCRLTGIWNVGSGNYAGNGIYFAPARSTALHYARGSLIVCRVSLGKVLDLGLAPHHVFKQCGYPNATGATKWGLDNGYVTGEWWRKDCKWWEYCMYDWKNRYNYSWRIRPLYVLDLYDKTLQQIPGGMCHWLFRKLVINDILTYIEEKLE